MRPGPAVQVACATVIAGLLAAAPAVLAQKALTVSPWNAAEVLPEVFPDKAWVEAKGGEAQVECQIVRDKTFERCTVTSESPAGYGFGAALARMAGAITTSPYGATMPGMEVTAAPRGARAEVRYAFTIPTNPNSSGLVMIGAISRHFPERAIRLERPGAGVIQCTASDTGRLTGCTLVSETPAGYGFGEAALASAHHFRVAPAQVKDKAGKTLTVPINFATGG